MATISSNIIPDVLKNVEVLPGKVFGSGSGHALSASPFSALCHFSIVRADVTYPGLMVGQESGEFMFLLLAGNQVALAADPLVYVPGVNGCPSLTKPIRQIKYLPGLSMALVLSGGTLYGFHVTHDGGADQVSAFRLMFACNAKNVLAFDTDEVKAGDGARSINLVVVDKKRISLARWTNDIGQAGWLDEDAVGLFCIPSDQQLAYIASLGDRYTSVY
ncbi:hypothetical protein KIPB_008297 [Kipferlia bialata]|uniref:Uncharacterized protein n=1 Tax=Kipferlia bialata TaxID=797122 RepID=A0A9K3GKN4_9EUKA|nr:hypothetical protein KIPB_008297 [Kipferlia bialata]|eukprot:g8297.t1